MNVRPACPFVYMHPLQGDYGHTPRLTSRACMYADALALAGCDFLVMSSKVMDALAAMPTMQVGPGSTKCALLEGGAFQPGPGGFSTTPRP